eukprot:407311_1
MKRSMYAISMTICLIVVMIILVIYFHIIKLFTRIKIKKSIQRGTHTSSIFGFIASILIFYVITYSYLNDSIELYDRNVYINIVLIGVCVLILKLSTYILFLLRLKLTFKDSIYRIPNYMFIILYVLFSLYAIVYLFIYYELLLLSSIGHHLPPNNTSESSHWDIIIILDFIIIAIDTVIEFSLLILFNGSLFKLMKTMSPLNKNDLLLSTKSYRYHSDNLMSSMYGATVRESQSETDIISMNTMIMLDEKQKDLLHIISRTSVLATVTIIATMIHQIMFIIATEWYRENASVILVIQTLQALYCLIEISCVFLSFKDNNKFYKLLCYPCSKYCNLCCVSMI